MGWRRRALDHSAAKSGAGNAGCVVDVMISRSSSVPPLKTGPLPLSSRDDIAPPQRRLLYQASHPSCATAVHRRTPAELCRQTKLPAPCQIQSPCSRSSRALLLAQHHSLLDGSVQFPPVCVPASLLEKIARARLPSSLLASVLALFLDTPTF